MTPLIQNHFKLNFWIGLFTPHRQWPSVSKLWPSCVHRLSKEFFPYKIYLQTNRLFSLITLSWSISSFESQTYMSCPCMAQWNWDSSHQELVDTPEVTNFFTLAYPPRFVISSHFPSLRSFFIFLSVQLCIFKVFNMFNLVFLDILCQKCFLKYDCKNRSLIYLLNFKSKW